MTQRDLLERATAVHVTLLTPLLLPLRLRNLLAPWAELLDELQRERAPRPLVPRHGGGEEDEEGAEETAHDRERDRSRLIDAHQLRVRRDRRRVLRAHVLHRLPVSAKDVEPDDAVRELLVR